MNWFGAVLTVALSALIGGIWISRAGMTAVTSSAVAVASRWPVIGLFAFAILAKAVSFGTLLLLDTAVAAFRKSLVHIETYARDEKYDNFADIFNEATDTIDAGKPAVEQGDMARFTGFDDRQAAIFEECSRAWVFGGMGSWNDLGGGERYDRVSQALYDSLNACIAALANSSFHG